MWSRLLCCCLLATLIRGDIYEDNNEFELSVIHLNDFHARFDEQSSTSGICKPEIGSCHGGFSRVYRQVKRLMQERKNPIFLNAGDNYQGTLWYNIFKWNVTQYFMNMLPTEAYTLGNHEFDQGIQGLIPFIKAMRAPLIVSNLDDSLVPEIQGLYNKSIVTNIDGKKVGIIGVIIASTPELSNTENLKFLDEIESVNKEADRLVKEENVFTVIVLSHCGYETELKMAFKATNKIGLIVGAHSHTLLYSGLPPDGSQPKGPYPTIVKREIDGKPVLVTQASSYTRYLGDIIVKYDSNGDVKAWKGQPIYLAPELPQDKRINKLLRPFKDIVDAIGNEVLGETLVPLLEAPCKNNECPFGNFLADTIVHSFADQAEPGCWTYASIGLINVGSIRTSIPKGNITYNDMNAAQPFENTFDSGILTGKHLLKVLEQTAEPYSYRRAYANVNLLQLSGLKVVYDLSKPQGERVTSVEVLSECANEYQPLDLEENYRVGMVSFLVSGGDGFTSISENLREHRKGKLDMDVFKEYLKVISPINATVEGRMVFNGAVQPIRRR